MLERDPPMPPCSDVAHADGAEYKATQRARNGSPQFLHGHVFLKRGWEVGANRQCKVALLLLRQVWVVPAQPLHATLDYKPRICQVWGVIESTAACPAYCPMCNPWPQESVTGAYSIVFLSRSYHNLQRCLSIVWSGPSLYHPKSLGSRALTDLLRFVRSPTSCCRASRRSQWRQARSPSTPCMSARRYE